MKKLLLTLMAGLAMSTAGAYQVLTPKGVMEASYANTEGLKASYVYQSGSVTPAATATDVVVLKGATGKVIRVTSITVTGTATAAANLAVYAYKRTEANTGGTATQPTPTKMDSADAAASAVVDLYSANPSALGAGGVVAADLVQLPAATSPAFGAVSWVETFGTRNARALVLRGAAEALAINLNGASLPAGTALMVRIEWTEE